MDGVVPREQNVLSSPVPGVESTGFDESRGGTINVGIAVLTTDRVLACLKIEGVSLLCVVLKSPA